MCLVVRQKSANIFGFLAQIILGAITAPVIGWFAGFDMASVLGIYSGAVTNTPALGAASQTLGTLPNIGPDRLELPALCYAVSYPMAIVGIIGSRLILKQLFRIDPTREAAEFAAKRQTPLEPIERRTLVVTNANLHGLRVDAIPGRIEALAEDEILERRWSPLGDCREGSVCQWRVGR